MQTRDWGKSPNTRLLCAAIGRCCSALRVRLRSFCFASATAERQWWCGKESHQGQDDAVEMGTQTAGNSYAPVVSRCPLYELLPPESFRTQLRIQNCVLLSCTYMKKRKQGPKWLHTNSSYITTSRQEGLPTVSGCPIRLAHCFTSALLSVVPPSPSSLPVPDPGTGPRALRGPSRHLVLAGAPCSAIGIRRPGRSEL